MTKKEKGKKKTDPPQPEASPSVKPPVEKSRCMIIRSSFEECKGCKWNLGDEWLNPTASHCSDNKLHVQEEVTKIEERMLEQKEVIKALKLKSELQINAITQNYEQRLDRLREQIGEFRKATIAKARLTMNSA